MSSASSDSPLPTLPPEIIGRILSLAAARARTELAPQRPVPAFLRQLALISRAWRKFGQAELLAEVPVRFLAFTSGSILPAGQRGLKLFRTLVNRPSLGLAVRRLVIYGYAFGDKPKWSDLLKRCPQLWSLSCLSSSLDLADFAVCKGLHELVLEDMNCYARNAAPLPEIRKLRIVDSYFDGPLAPALFPKLEALVLLYQREADDVCAALGQIPSLRALVISVDVPLDLATCPLKAENILWDVVAFRWIETALGEWPGERQLVHLRCAARDHAAELMDRFDEKDPMLEALQTVQVVLKGTESELDGEDLCDLREAGAARGVAVAREAEVAESEFGFDWFVEKHGKPRAVEG